MANLTRWKKLVPKWEGNDLDPDPFRVEVRRLSIAEREEFRERLANATESGESMGTILGSYVRGPIGELSFDGEPFKGGIPELVDGMVAADPVAYQSLIKCLLGLVVATNDVDGAAAQG